MSKLHIAIIIWKDGFGGAERHLHDLAVAIDRTRFEVVFIYLSGSEGPFSKEIEKLGVKTIYLKWKNGYDIFGRFKLISLLKQFKPDLVHVHLLPLLIILFIRLFINCPVLYTEHGIACRRDAKLENNIIRQFIERIDFLFCEIIAANSQASAEALGNVYKIVSSKVQVIHLGINLNQFTAKKQKQMKYTIGFLGRIQNSIKGVDRLPHVAKFMVDNWNNEFKYIIAGDGEDRSKVEWLCLDLGVDQFFEFIGWTSDAQKFLSKIDVLVIPSRMESFGLVALEAFVMNIPVVAFNTGGLREILEECPIGYLVPQGDIEQMAQTICSLQDSYKSTEDLGYNYVKEHFSNEIMAKNFEKLYIKITQRD